MGKFEMSLLVVLPPGLAGSSRPQVAVSLPGQEELPPGLAGSWLGAYMAFSALRGHLQPCKEAAAP